MKNRHLLLRLLVLAFVFSTAIACKKDDGEDKTRPELLQRNWKARRVLVNNNVVYEEPFSQPPDTEDYTSYRLNFTAGNNFSRTEIDGTVVAGTYTFPDENRVVFITGAPNEVSVTNLANDALTITYTVSSQKTGNREYQIELSPAQ